MQGRLGGQEVGRLDLIDPPRLCGRDQVDLPPVAGSALWYPGGELQESEQGTRQDPAERVAGPGVRDVEGAVLPLVEASHDQQAVVAPLAVVQLGIGPLPGQPGHPGRRPVLDRLVACTAASALPHEATHVVSPGQRHRPGDRWESSTVEVAPGLRPQVGVLEHQRQAVRRTECLEEVPEALEVGTRRRCRELLGLK